ncbi:putative membrane protein [Bacteroides fragilis str. 3986 T(B)9]|nr:hypothetical protein HMPREF0101_00499 [Bacteroides fragilis]EXY58170.1 putative membrane protein [Bacteroides fragilis str. 3986T(B)10]EXY70848.1 putative membrane protein [Bacteroides fragilis str. 3986 T(B)9]EXY85219.1 putative membrane protein [Bacteroides fragilis str. 3996 N(B) 6]EXY97917.1 putative membrane protein [Bacteroides fragilis str. 3998 T(B) 4]EXZ68746.1 putative membrane protein [Bacteroides fragilis str. 3783N1-8]EYA29982.1 putative membrane protein [Bacteroides fragilis 
MYRFIVRLTPYIFGVYLIYSYLSNMYFWGLFASKIILVP